MAAESLVSFGTFFDIYAEIETHVKPSLSTDEAPTFDDVMNACVTPHVLNFIRDGMKSHAGIDIPEGELLLT